jgi:hypothetical protein
MTLFQISYDLRNHATMGQYEELIAELERMGAKRIQKSEWVWKGTDTVADVRDHIAQYIHVDDRLFVVAVSTWAGRNSMFNVNNL